MQDLMTFVADAMCKPGQRAGYFVASMTCFPYLMLSQENT